MKGFLSRAFAPLLGIGRAIVAYGIGATGGGPPAPTVYVSRPRMRTTLVADTRCATTPVPDSRLKTTI